MKAHFTSMASTCFVATVFFLASPVQAQSGPSQPDESSLETPISSTYSVSVSDADIGKDLASLNLMAPASLSESEWKKFGNAVENGLSSSNDGVRTSALRLIIAYGSQFKLTSSAVVDVMHLYREGHSEQIRRMAVVSLGNMNSNLADGFLELSAEYEQSEPIKATIEAVLADHAAVRAF